MKTKQEFSVGNGKCYICAVDNAGASFRNRSLPNILIFLLANILTFYHPYYVELRIQLEWTFKL